jgi:putative ABC transport system permease protein
VLAGREVRRAKLRFGLLSAAVGLLVFLIMFQQALLGSLLLSFTGAIENQSGTVIVFSEEARKNISGSVILPAQQAQIEGVTGVGATAPLGQTTLTIEAGGDDTDTSVFGFNPTGPGEPTRVVEGRLPTSPTEAVASREDESLGFGLGDIIVSVDGGIPLTVVGLTERSRFSVAPTIWVTFDGYAALRKASNPDATAVLPSVLAITPADGVSPGDLAAEIDDQVDGVQALTRSQAVNEAPGVSSVNTSFQLILGLAFLVVAVVIGFFFLILTVQKQSTLTVLRAIGAPTSYLLKALLKQIVLVVGVGIVLGGLLTYGAVKGASAGLPISIEPGTLALTAAGVVLLSLVGSGFTLLRVSRIDPADVMNRQNAGGLA